VKHFLQNLKRNVIVAGVGIIFVVTAAIALIFHYSDLHPQSDDELARVHNAIQAVARGDIQNLQQNRDGSVTAFVTSGHYSKQTIVAEKVGDKWNASVTMIHF
jgi:hypothetical protein